MTFSGSGNREEWAKEPEMPACEKGMEHYWDIYAREETFTEVEARCENCGLTRIYGLISQSRKEGAA